MAKNKSFLQEAVVAAKEVREAAIQHAYKELEENLTPSIKEALAQKLEEDLDIEGLEEGTGAVAGFKPVKVKEPKKAIKEDDEPEEEEEIETSEEVTEEPETEDEETSEEPEEDEELPDTEEEDGGDPSEEDHEEPSDDTELKDLTLGDLKELIATMVSAIAPEKPAEQPEDMVPADVQGKGEEDTPIEPEDSEEVEISDDEIETEDGEEEEKKDKEDVEINLNELLKELESEEHDRKVVSHKQDAEFQKELNEVKAERDKALATVQEMKETCREMNLLNAKLTHTVKLFSKPLSESQRARAIKSLDEAQTVKEVKAIYRTLTESFGAETKRNNGLIREHRGSASRPVGKSTAPVVEVDPVVKRFQQLAGII